MGSDLYEVKVAKKSGVTVTLDLQSVHPDANTIPAEPDFALTLLYEAAGKKDPLAREVSLDDLIDRPWLKRWTRGFVRSVKVMGVKNRPPAAALRDHRHPYWRPESFKTWVHGSIEITASDAAWVNHLKRGAKFDSRAHTRVKKYDACDEIHPGDPLPAPNADDAFVWVPRECFLSGAWMMKYERLPRLLEMPAYSPSAYEVVEAMTAKKLDLARLAQWQGRAVWADDATFEAGSLGYVQKPDSVMHLSMSRGGGGSGDCKVEGTIGLMVPKPGRRGTRMGYDLVLARTPTVVTAIERRGAEVVLTLAVPPGNSVPVATAPDVLLPLIDPLVRKGFNERLRDSFLTRGLAAIQTERGVKPDYGRIEDDYDELGRRAVASFALTPPAKTDPIAFSKLSHAQVRDALLRPWPTAKLKVKATDPRWVEHLPPRSEVQIPLRLEPRVPRTP